MAIIFWVKTMMNVDKIVKLQFGEPLIMMLEKNVEWPPTSLNRDSKLPDKS